AAAAGPAAAASAAGRTARRTASTSAHRDRRQELDGVVVALRAGARSRGLGHGPVQLERVATGAAAVLIAGHRFQFTRRARPRYPSWPGWACRSFPGREGPARSEP